MSWWDSENGIIGDGPADAMADAIAMGFPSGLPSARALMDGLSAALSAVGPTSLHGGKHLRFASLHLPNDSGPSLDATGQDADATARTAFAGFLDAQRRSYRARWKRPPRPSEIMETLGFVVGASPAKYVSDSEGHDFRRARADFVDSREALAPSATLAALFGFVRAEWPARFDPATSLESVHAELVSGETLVPEGKPDAQIMSEIGVALKQLVRDELFKPAEDRRVSAFERALRVALNLQPERFLGGADGRLKELTLTVSDPRPRVRHEKFGEGRVVSTNGSGTAAKLEIAFADRTCVLIASFVERL